jgi:[ribosomal protein S5]-alanine N-acetyltransferase
MEYSSERLRFKEFTRSDFDRFYSVFSNDEVMNYALIDKFESEEAIQPFFEEVLANNAMLTGRRALAFAVSLLSNDSFIGFAEIEIHNKQQDGGCGEVGYFLLPEFWGQGYATEAARSLLAMGFKYFNLHRISARCNANNLRSENVMKKTGMIKEGELRKVRFKHNQWVNEKQYGILIEDWEKQMA